MQIRRITGLLVLSLITAFFLSACGGGGGGDSAPDLSPVATTVPANSVTNNSAVLNAIVNPKGLSTTAWFEYSKDPALVSNVITTTPQVLGSGSTDNAITQIITGLDSGQTYSFRVTATNSAGTKKGATFTLSTLPLPTVTTNPATSITTTGATLNAIVNPNGRDTTAWFEYGKTVALGTSTDNQFLGNGVDNVIVTETLSPLDVATQYFFRVVASSSAGTSNGTTLSFTTAGGVPLVTTKAATSVTTTGGVLNADVNPSGLATVAWFEYGKDNTFASFTTTDNQAITAGTSAVPIPATISGFTLGETIYYRVAASNIVGPSLKGEVFNFTTLNPPPTANAGPDQTVYMAGPFGDLGFLGTTTVSLSGSGSTDPGKTVASYLWEQIAGGTAVTLVDSASPTPTFAAPALSYGTSEDLQFKLTVTDNTGLTGTDNVLVTNTWGFLDDFSTDSTGTYTKYLTLGTTAIFIHDAAGERGRVTTGAGQGIGFGKELKIVLPGPDTQLYTSTGVFSLVFYPSSQYGSGGRITIRLLDSPNTYYEFSTQNDWLIKVRSGLVVDSAPFTTSYSQGGTYPIRITFSPTLTTVEAFGGTASLTTDENSNTVNYFQIESTEQNGYFDNIKLEAAP